MDEDVESVFCPLEIQKWNNSLIKLNFGEKEPISLDTYSLLGYLMMFIFYRATMKYGDLYTNMYSLITENSRKAAILEYMSIIAVQSYELA